MAGEDYYRQKAAELFKVPYDKVTVSQRQKAKQAHYLEAYSKGAKLKR